MRDPLYLLCATTESPCRSATSEDAPSVLDPAADPASAETIHRVRLLRVGLHGFVSLEAAGAFGHPADVDLTFERRVEALTAPQRGPGVVDARRGSSPCR